MVKGQGEWIGFESGVFLGIQSFEGILRPKLVNVLG